MLRFDEPIDDRQAPRLSKLILVNPSVPEFDLELDGDAIRIDPRAPMLDGVTYMVTILPGLADRGGNATKTAKTILFSVGGEAPITLSLVRATILRDTLPAIGAEYLLDNRDAGFAYHAVADSQGRVELEGLAYGAYVATAWLERVRPEGWQATEEPGARDSFELGAQSRSHEATYRLAVVDTTPAVVERVEMKGSRLLTIRLDDALEGTEAPPKSAIRLYEAPPGVPAEAAVDTLAAERLRGRRMAISVVERGGPNLLQAAPTEPLRNGRAYRLEVVGVRNVDGLESTPAGGRNFRASYTGPAVFPAERIPWPEPGSP